MNKQSIKRAVSAGAMTTLLSIINQSHAQDICVWDVMGASGDSYALMKDFVVAARGTGANLNLIAYSDESKALADFKAGKCDGAALTDFSTRQFNSFTGSINAIGAISNNAMAKVVLGMMGNSKLDDDMVMDNYEVAGVFPLGAAYLVTHDRSINSLSKIQGMRFAVIESDKAQMRMVKKIGAKPVPITVPEISRKFNTHQVDIIGAPAMAFGPFELAKGIGSTGGIVRFPVSFVTMNLILKRDKFPTTLGPVGRRWFAAQTGRMMDNVIKIENSIDDKYWMDLNNNDKVGYIKLMREMRIDLIKDGVYNKKMTALLKRVRCKQDATSFECALNDE